jgi:hypothetical protein
MMKNRPPYDAEVDAEVAKEYERLQAEKRRSRPDHGREIEAVRTRVLDLEGTVTRLGEKVDALHKRMEDMMQKILQNQGQKQVHVGEDTMEPSSSAQMLETSALTSTTAPTTTPAQQPVAVPILTSMGVADAPLPSEDPITIDVAKDAAIDVCMNNQEAQTTPTSVIGALVEEIILRNCNKSTDGNAIVEPAEPEPEETPVVPTPVVDEGVVVPDTFEDAPEQIGISEQVI